MFDINPRGAILDPACSSGTFLYQAIREKRERLRDSVYGADVHSLAAIVAKTNYILALGDLLKKRKGPVTIPVYLANTIKLPEPVKQTKMVVSNGALVAELLGYRDELDGREIHLPLRLIQNVVLYDQAIELAKDFAVQSATYMCACVAGNKLVEFEIGGQRIEARGIVVNEGTYHFETDDEAEAHYWACLTRDMSPRAAASGGLPTSRFC